MVVEQGVLFTTTVFLFILCVSLATGSLAPMGANLPVGILHPGVYLPVDKLHPGVYIPVCKLHPGVYLPGRYTPGWSIPTGRYTTYRELPPSFPGYFTYR